MKLHKVISATTIILLVTGSLVAQNPMDMMKTMERLKGLTPLSIEKLKTALPENLSQMQRRSLSTGENPSLTSIEGSYHTANEPEFLTTNVNGVTGDALNEKYKTVTIGITDGAGVAGSGMVSSFEMMINMPFAANDANKNQKITEKNGIKAIETYNKDRNQSELQFIYDGRFMISISATKRTPEETWDIIPLLNLNALKE